MNFLRDRTVGIATNGLFLLMAAALMFMLIGCANVANLLLARGFARQREISVRLALGAGRARIVRQLLTESGVLAALGALGGYLLTAAAWKILPALAPVSIPRLAAARADGTVFGFALALALINGILFGIAPALRLARLKAAVALGAFGSRGAAAGGRDRIRSALVVAEVALSVMLVVVGGQTARQLRETGQHRSRFPSRPHSGVRRASRARTIPQARTARIVLSAHSRFGSSASRSGERRHGRRLAL